MAFPILEFIKTARSQNKSEDYINECINYAKNLDEKQLPVIFSIVNLAILMKIQSDYLKVLIGEVEIEKRGQFENNEEYKYKRYNYFKLKKRRGGYREIMSPAKDLKYIQKWILRNILEKYPLANSCKGFQKRISIKDNATGHHNSDLILKVDLLKFYDTITERRVYGMFSSMGYAKNLSYSLAKLTTAKHRDSYWLNFDKTAKHTLEKLIKEKPSILPQGAPSSPMIANILATKMDSRFEKLSKKMGFHYSRYADDLTFSITKDAKLPPLLLIKKIIRDEGFFINPNKICYMKKGSKQYVTGLTVNNGVNVHKGYRKDIGQHIHYCRKFGVISHLQKREKDFPKYNTLTFHDWLYGHICFIKSINKADGEKLLKKFNLINWHIKKK